MTKEQLYEHLATGSITVKSKNPIPDATSEEGYVVSLTICGKEQVEVFVQFPGKKFPVCFFNGTAVGRHVKPLDDLQPADKV